MSSVEQSVRALENRAVVARSSIYATFAGAVIAHFLVDCLGGIWPVYKTLAGLNVAVAGGIQTVVVMIGTATQPFFGLWADSHGARRRLLVLGTGLCLIAPLLGPLTFARPMLGATWSYAAMAAMLFAVRVGQDMFHPVGAALAGNLVAGRRSTLVAIFIAMGSVGLACSQSSFSFVFERANGHTELLLLIAAPLWLLSAAMCRPVETSQAQPTRLIAAMADLFRAGRPLLLVFLVLTLTGAAIVGMQFLMPELCRHRGYPDWVCHGGAYFFMIIGSVFVMIVAGHLADRVGRRRTLLAGLLLATASYYAIVAMPRVPLPLFLTVCFVGGGFLGVTNPLGIAFGQHLSPRNTSMVSAIMMGLAWCLSSVSPSIVGYCFDRTGALVSTLGCLGAVNVVAIGVAVLLPRDQAVQTPDTA